EKGWVKDGQSGGRHGRAAFRAFQGRQGRVCAPSGVSRQCRRWLRPAGPGPSSWTVLPKLIRPMTSQIHDALIHVMIVAATSDSAITERELTRITALIERLPVFDGFDKGRLTQVANQCADVLNGPDGLDRVLDEAIAALPAKLQDTAYALAVEVTAVDL